MEWLPTPARGACSCSCLMMEGAPAWHSRSQSTLGGACMCLLDAGRHRHPRRDRAIIAFILLTGCRDAPQYPSS